MMITCTRINSWLKLTQTHGIKIRASMNINSCIPKVCSSHMESFQARITFKLRNNKCVRGISSSTLHGYHALNSIMMVLSILTLLKTRAEFIPNGLYFWMSLLILKLMYVLIGDERQGRFRAVRQKTFDLYKEELVISWSFEMDNRMKDTFENIPIRA